MRLSHRSLFVSLLITVFLIILLGKIDGRSNWTWFSIFTPIWILDLFTYLLYYARQRTTEFYYDFKSKHIIIGSIILKLIFQCLLCVKLEYFESLSLFIVFIPLWIFLIIISVNVFREMIINDED
ncbi:transmembrane protein 60 [Dermatophagoides pteronyssinus]|uniref:Transmembrane protein 60-like n=2 Tax=Dermatophagoides pteronyssinus TaxID=6956 RepID=A0A6P6XZG3_DERPT|nr:transmembrane protein 60-like [Dermatophagoides pteronyssinus]KAH9417486.1 Transmembrane protein 60 [Dermatophagoides pteronyssinus]